MSNGGHTHIGVQILCLLAVANCYWPNVTAHVDWFYIRSQSSFLISFVLEETGNEQPIVVSSEAGRDGQLWKWEGDSLVSKNNLSLDIKKTENWENGNWVYGPEVIAWPPHNGPNQIWKFEDDLIVSRGLTNFGLEIEISDATQRATVIAKNITGNREQLWSLVYPAEPVCCSGWRCKCYRGTTSTTRSGRTCQAWNTQSPHKHYWLTPAMFPYAGLDVNYCRNPTGSPGGAWCYTTDKNKRWEYCDIPKVCRDTHTDTGVNTHILTDHFTGHCNIEENYAYPGNTIAKISVASLEGCKQGCLILAKCVGFDYDKRKSDGWHDCWLKDKMLGRIERNYVISGHCISYL